VRKIRALGIDVDEPIIGYSPRITARDAAFAPLQGAIERSVVVAFDYLKPGRSRLAGAACSRSPWSSTRRAGTCSDATSTPTATACSCSPGIVGTCDHADAFAAELREGAGERALTEPGGVAAAHSALLEIARAPRRLCVSAGAPTRRAGIRVPYVDVHIFADELASYGPEVRVVEPAVRER
jgi:proteasome accessory factor B